MENPDRTIINSDITEHDLNRFSEAGIVAIDCETGGLNPLRDNLYLVQLADINGEIKIIKTTDWHQAKNLRSLLCDDKITKVSHFAVMDCGFLMLHLDIDIKGAYCTKIASKIARTYSSSHSLSSLIKEFFDFTIDKKLQTSFWGSAEISSAQMAYAANDVKYLLDIKNKLERILEEKGSLVSRMTYSELNRNCQATIPLLTHLWVNGWDFGKEDPNSVFGK
jgi:ribonuclease D